MPFGLERRCEWLELRTKGDEGKERLMGARHAEPRNDSSRAQRPGMVSEGRLAF